MGDEAFTTDSDKNLIESFNFFPVCGLKAYEILQLNLAFTRDHVTC